ncbi:alpha/beta fold family hydrolase [Aspergillus nomiae NRRL 13137]|uniref:Alpha/beta fold family hydrolase n=1 Tax=Aspergillus nomiae NRRL (strain ATCC 15546 / NRRL 13137 / CBS 260.88 / M93) TaxID=1509407 RepID=A0A0L1INB4_ASPN3|nr:alpha/beta fold family hydrolase [Aspergillus nomiae NRRL 13137]KNG81076.1 alpha/beta fold family hydrolase [Aspergillus nomiae NRRL 13137]
MGAIEDLKIPSSRDHSLQIALSIFSPENCLRPRPVIVMCHGIGAIKAAGLAPFASAFAAKGYYAITFDYLHFGESDGQPRNFLSISGELQDFRDVIAWARQQPDRFDPKQIVVWGSSFGGMHTTAIIASDHELAGAIAQCPCVDSFAAAKRQPLLKSLRITQMAISDGIRSLFGKEPIYINLTGNGSSGSAIALMEGSEVIQGWQRISPSDVAFPNIITARSLLEFPMHRPVLGVKKSKKPYLIVLPTYDNEAPLEAAEAAVRNAPLGEGLRVPGGHFDLYAGGIAFDANLSGQLAFLDRILV